MIPLKGDKFGPSLDESLQVLLWQQCVTSVEFYPVLTVVKEMLALLLV
jgi:hypothetical protein